MQKKLLAVAVAGALFSPLAMAQSAVTISGVFKVGIDNFKVGNPNAARDRSSEARITDNSSRIIFGITEDLGGGLAGIAQLDVRPQLDDAGETNVAAGNSWVGIRSSSLGTVTFGRHDLHYGKQPDDTSALAGALMASSVSLMDHTYLSGGNAANAGLVAAAVAGAGLPAGVPAAIVAAPTAAIANATRTPNVIRYDSPNWSGFAATVAYSTSPFGNESDMSTTAATSVRKGNAWNFNPSYTSGPFQVGLSYWKAKGDPSAAGIGYDQKSMALYGYYRFGAFKVGAAMNDSEVDVISPGAETQVVDRRNWTIPVSWTMGAHNVAAHYTRAGQDKAADDAGIEDTGARMIAVSYTYSLSKRTSVGLTYAKINNDDNASYNLFTNSGGLGSAASGVIFGEDPRLMALTVRHAF